MLEIIELETGYGKKKVLNGVSIKIEKGEIVALIGPNGAGKSTVLKAVFGLLRTWGGKIIFEGKEIQNHKPSLNVRDGLSYVPQGSRVFDELTVLENLEVGGYILDRKRELKLKTEETFDLFPKLKERMHQSAGKLSGGEKQMLALGRALMLSPTLILLDEPSLGLAPKSAGDAIQAIKEINTKLKTTVLIVEQNVKEVLNIADRVYGLKLGKLVFHGTPEDIREMDRIRQIFL
ncbi:MAG: ABC transporter ATP-binding protein [Thermodesulfobacteriota bacterium]